MDRRALRRLLVSRLHWLLILVLLSTLFSAPLAFADWTGGHVVMGASQAKTDWLFAEGCTRNGYNTYLCIYNPATSGTVVYITYYLEAGPNESQTIFVDPGTRTTVYVNEAFYGEHDVACRLTSSTPVIAERSVYFNSYGRTGGHVSMGAGDVMGSWYFAEGCTQPGFDEYICMLNPSNSSVETEIRYMDENGGVTPERVTLVPYQRFTRNVRDILGDNKNISVEINGLSSTDKFVAERPMYFNYQGKWNGGHDALGVNSLSKKWYFGEGCTRPGFDTWVTLLNPASAPASLTILYQLASGATVSKGYIVAAHSRRTVNVVEDVGPNQDVSCVVTSGTPIAAERPMYFLYRDKWDGGSVAFGATMPQTTSMFAEGCSRSGFETWFCIQNPNSVTVDANMTFTKKGSSAVTRTIPAPAHARVTVDANLILGPECDFSASVSSAKGLIVERPMYFDYAGKGPNFAPPPEPTPPAPTPPSPTPPAAAVNMITHRGLDDGIGNYWIYGILENDTGASVEFVKVTAAAFNSSGTLLATETGYADIDVMDNGDKSGVSVLFYPKPAGMSSYQITNVEWDSSSVPRNRDVVITSTNAYHQSGYYRLAGNLRNQSTTGTHQYVGVSIAYFNGGTFVCTDTAYADADTMSPGQNSTFSTMTSEVRFGSINRTEMWVDCQN